MQDTGSKIYAAIRSMGRGRVFWHRFYHLANRQTVTWSVFSNPTSTAKWSCPVWKNKHTRGKNKESSWCGFFSLFFWRYRAWQWQVCSKGRQWLLMAFVWRMSSQPLYVHDSQIELMKRDNKTIVIPEGTPESQLGILINKFTRGGGNRNAPGD